MKIKEIAEASIDWNKQVRFSKYREVLDKIKEIKIGQAFIVEFDEPVRQFGSNLRGYLKGKDFKVMTSKRDETGLIWAIKKIKRG